MNFFSPKKYKQGFTLVEMMVSVSIFAIVAVVAIGALLKIIDANKKAQSLETSINNLNFVLDSITREMRVGTNYKCFHSDGHNFSDTAAQEQCLNSGSWTIVFDSSERSADDACALKYAYYFNGDTISKAEQGDCNDLDPTFYPIISNNEKADSKIHFDYGILSLKIEPKKQPYAQFHFVGYAGVKENVRTTFDLQTTVSQRLPD